MTAKEIHNSYELELLLNWIFEIPEAIAKGQYISLPLSTMLNGLLPDLETEYRSSNSGLLFSHWLHETVIENPTHKHYAYAQKIRSIVS